ncbi:hypothetical protein PV10_01256 [Exophiala mesophila]|uniref:DUF7924 domain-containing protein n=1 Tax=Exophiala mesophila TaxID=212818 RepID=A0A0D1ZUD1_EXOME|nr:uncharacterized protein PV10_01256 [Exophiala mesophila]KIV97509.1 hypothetical protein PV10_01256 [Exophiala mesophila]
MDDASKTQVNSQKNQPESSQPELPLSQIPLKTSRKRQIESDSSNDEPRLTRVRLTRRNLATFDKMGKKKNSDPTDGSLTTTKTTSTTSSGFAIKARNNGILHPDYSKPPINLDDIRKRHARTRATASPPESTYEDYVNQVDRAGNEATLVADTSRKLLKEYSDKGYNHTYNRQFTDFRKASDLPTVYPPHSPISSKDLRQKEFAHDPRSLALPHFAGEWKGPDGSIDEARMQSAYDGAALVHARTKALAHMGKEDPPGHAEITTFTIDGTNLNLYAHYAAPSAEDGDTLHYHQYPVSSKNLTSTYQGYKDGRKSLRNAQDNAKTQSEQLRDQLKQHWKQHRNQLPPVAEGVDQPDVELPPHTTDGYEDTCPHVLQEEAEDDYEIIQPTTNRESSHRHHSSSLHSSKSHRSSAHHSSSTSTHHSANHSSSHKRKAPSSQTSSHGSPGHTSKRRI